MKATMDGNEAAAYASYAFTEVAAIYPITPSSPMAEHIDTWAANGKKNIFGNTVRLVEMQSEAGAISTVHGATLAGTLTSTYTSSQGLLLMVPTMYRIAGNLRPSVIHVASRSVALHGYSIHAEHSDVMACRQTGYAMLASSSVQEAMDLGAVAHLASIRSSIPFLHFFDGFRTSHEIQKIDCLDYADLAKLVDREALERFRRSALNPNHPEVVSTGQGPDVYFQVREACSARYERVADDVAAYMEEIGTLTGRRYQPFSYCGTQDAETVVIAMGSVAGACMETVEALTKAGKKVGFINVHLYRPWSMKYFLQALPETARDLVVLDRTKENGALGEPLYEDVCAAVAETGRSIRVTGGRYGIGGKDTTPEQICAALRNAEARCPKNHFTLGIHDDVMGTSLPAAETLAADDEGLVSCMFWGLGSDGTVSANKNAIKIIGACTDKYIQAYFEYDGKKSGGLTKSHLRFGQRPILASYGISRADFVACHKASFLHKYDMWSVLKPGGAFLLNCAWDEADLKRELPDAFKRFALENHIRLYTIDASRIAEDLGLGSRTNTLLQAAFFGITKVIPIEQAAAKMKESVLKTYGSKGDDVVAKNYQAVDAALEQVRAYEITEEWLKETGWVEKQGTADGAPEYVDRIMKPVLTGRGGTLPVSTFYDYADGHMPAGTAKYELRGIANHVPEWDPNACVQCNRCSYVCPNGTIHPFLVENTDDTVALPKLAKAAGRGLEGYRYIVQVDPMDCVGCGSCVSVCPRSGSALRMAPLASQLGEQENWELLSRRPSVNPLPPTNVKNAQFAKPLLSFPGCCPGCGETPYVKQVTQLFGERMTIAAATGCSAVWATDFPAAPYMKNERGRGPAMANSLFENNGEFGYGMALAGDAMRERVREYTQMLASTTQDPELRRAAEQWIAHFEDKDGTVACSDAFVDALEKRKEGADKVLVAQILENRDFLSKKSVWIIGGDGWAYDIGYGGLDHVLASGQDVNILVLDTEVYSNTGGQASKATQKGAVAQFAAAGRRASKKDLGRMAMAYGNVYVASVAMGANYEQYLKVLQEAESFNGPSLIIAYAPCINHGLKCGMSDVMGEMRRAVEAGYWFLYRYDPRRSQEGKNPFVLDSGEPTGDFQAFLAGEVRFASLRKTFPQIAETLDREAEQEAHEKYSRYLRMTEER